MYIYTYIYFNLGIIIYLKISHWYSINCLRLIWHYKRRESKSWCLKKLRQDGYSRRFYICCSVMNCDFTPCGHRVFERTYVEFVCDVSWWGRSILQLPNSNQPDSDSRRIPLSCFSVPRQCVWCVFWCVLVHIATHQRTCSARESIFVSYVTRNFCANKNHRREDIFLAMPWACLSDIQVIFIL